MIDVRFSSFFLLDQENLNTNTFITSFRTIHSAQTMSIHLANQFFDYAITKSSINLKRHKSDFFTYITSEKYTSNKFYRIIIDIRASKQSTAGYKQYLAYKKNVSPIKVNKAKTGAVNV